MADPIKLRIANAISARLAVILTASGYHTNAGQRVTIGRPTIDAETELPCLAIRQGVEEATVSAGKGETAPPTGGSQKMNMKTEFNVDGYISVTQVTTGTQQMLIEADIKRAMNIGTPIEESGLKIGPLQYLGSEPFTREDGSDAEGVRVKFACIYTEKFGDPYATASQQ